jgi:hypothetical protein
LIAEDGVTASASELLAEKKALVLRILTSPALQSSRKCQQLLEYITECTLHETLDECTEQQIGIHVFGRSPGYNAAEDSIVRSQVRLLRQRLETYFESEGRDEPLRLEIPRGHYIASFRPRGQEPIESPDPAAAGQPTVVTLAPHAVPQLTEVVRRRFLMHWTIWLCLLLLPVAFWTGTRWTRPTPAQPQIPQLWAGFLQPGSEPLVIFSNAVFVGNGVQGLRYATGSEPHSVPVMDHYTGTGEVAAVYQLTRLFDRNRENFMLKRSLLVTWDDARSRNLIFVGAPLENPSLDVIPDSPDFNFVRDGDAFDIVNRLPMPGEPQRMNHSGWPMTFDYAIVSLRPGFAPGTKMLIFSGMTTIGTQAAVEFACSPAGASQLLPPSLGSKKPYFEAVIMISVSSGVPISSKIIAMHRS